MSNFDIILFDLDGTLTDSELGITSCVEYALNHFGIEVEDKKSLRPFIGPPLAECFRKYYGMTAEMAETAVAKYRERYTAVGMFENRVYDGIDVLLDKLKQQDKTLVVATSKPEKFAVRVLEHFGLDGYFDEIIGAELHTGGRNSKEDVIQFALDRLGVVDKSSVVMVGDTKFDLLGATICGIRCIGVLYGFGSREELSGCLALAESAADLEEILL